MSQERFNGLATCSIEKDILENVDLNIVINDFALKMPGGVIILSIHNLCNLKYCQWTCKNVIFIRYIHPDPIFILLLLVKDL
jgi:hypothetical protein